MRYFLNRGIYYKILPWAHFRSASSMEMWPQWTSEGTSARNRRAPG